MTNRKVQKPVKQGSVSSEIAKQAVVKATKAKKPTVAELQIEVAGLKHQIDAKETFTKCYINEINDLNEELKVKGNIILEQEELINFYKDGYQRVINTNGDMLDRIEAFNGKSLVEKLKVVFRNESI